ncbi:MAG: hypothetical protein K2P44_07130 [Lachnospiraceae bacterium]|nr:hypothetical protein [Lachnospiraceae bacterium]
MGGKMLLFGRINPQKTDLFKEMEGAAADGDYGLSDTTMSEIRENLTVSSLDDFVERFLPDSCLGLFELLARLMDDRRRKRYVMTDAAEIYGAMFPENRAQKQECIRKRNQLIKHAVSDESAALFQYLQQMADTKLGARRMTGQLLEDICSGLQRMSDCHADRALRADIPGVPVRILGRSAQPERPVYDLDAAQRERYRQMLDAYARAPDDGCENKNLVVEWLSIPLHLSDGNEKRLMAVYEKYSETYRGMYQKYWRDARPAVETALGVKLLFDNAAARRETRQLLVSNLSMRDMMHVRNQEKLDLYLQTANTKLYTGHAVGQAVFPSLFFRDKEVGQEKTVRRRFPISNQSARHPACGHVTAGEAGALMDKLETDILDRWRVAVICSDADTSRLPVLSGEDTGYVPCPSLVYDEMQRRVRVEPGKTVWFDALGIEDIFADI